MARSTRTFVAVDVSEETRARAGRLLGELAAADSKVKWVDPRNLHVTLKFLGDVDTRELGEVCAAVAAAVREAPPFDFCVRGCGAFPTTDSPRTIWLGVEDGADELIALHEMLEKGLAGMGFRREQRRFRPHLTLGRVRNNPAGLDELMAILEENRDLVAGVTGVDEVKVYSSELNREGPAYEMLSTATLAGK